MLLAYPLTIIMTILVVFVNCVLWLLQWMTSRCLLHKGGQRI